MVLYKTLKLYVFYSYPIRMTLTKSISSRINELLIRNDKSKYWLINKSNVSQTAMAKIFRGDTKDVSLSTVVKIATAFDMTLSEFFNSKVFWTSKVDYE